MGAAQKQQAGALFMVAQGNPMATEHFAKGLHKKLLKRIAKVVKGTDMELRRAVGGALQDLDAELRESQPGLEGCGAAVALILGMNLCVAVAGPCGATVWREAAADQEAAAPTSEIGK